MVQREAASRQRRSGLRLRPEALDLSLSGRAHGKLVLLLS